MQSPGRVVVVVIAAVVLLSAAAVHAGPVRFSVLELGEANVVALNNSGQVVGTSGALGPQCAFRTRPNRPLAPGDILLDGPEENMGLAQRARPGRLDARRQPLHHAVARGRAAPPNRATDNIIPPGSPQLWPHDVNNEGRVVGMILHGSTIGPSEVFRTGPGVQYDPATDDLGTLGGTAPSPARSTTPASPSAPRTAPTAARTPSACRSDVRSTLALTT